MITKPLKTAFIGGGINSAVGLAHKIAISMDGCFHLIAGAFSVEEEINQASGNSYGIDPSHVFNDWRKMLSAMAGQLDVLIIITPTTLHTEMILECIKYNIAIVCEKSLCCDSDEALIIKKELNKTHSFLAVTYNYSGYPMVRELKARIEASLLGKINQIHIEMPQESFIRKNPITNKANLPQHWRQKDGKNSMLALDLGVHIHQLIDFLTNEKPMGIFAIESHDGVVSDVIDNTMCLAKYTNNLNCNVWFGKTALGYRNGLRIRVMGTEGSAEWIQTDPEQLCITDAYGKKSLIDRSDSENLVAIEQRYHRFKAGHPSGFIEAFANYYQDVFSSIVSHQSNSNDQCPYVYGIDTALEGLFLLEAIRESSASQQWITVQCT